MRAMTLPILLSSAAVAAALGAASPAVAPAYAQDARACADEVQRLSEGFSLDRGGASSPGGGISAGQPGTRAGASGLNDTQRSQVRELTQQARAAGQRGDGPQCMQKLNEARAMLRQAGVGSPRSSGVVQGAQDRPADQAPNLQGSEAPPETRGTPRDNTVTGPGTRATGDGTATGSGNPALSPQGAQRPAVAPTPRRNTRDSATGTGGGATGNAGGSSTSGGGAGGSSGGR